MGLFIGASVLTILEIFDYLYEVKWKHSHLFNHLQVFSSSTVDLRMMNYLN